MKTVDTKSFDEMIFDEWWELVKDKPYSIPKPYEGSIGGRMNIGPTYQMQGDCGLAVIVGPYCYWPKQEPKIFIVGSLKAGTEINISHVDKLKKVNWRK